MFVPLGWAGQVSFFCTVYETDNIVLWNPRETRWTKQILLLENEGLGMSWDMEWGVLVPTANVSENYIEGKLSFPASSSALGQSQAMWTWPYWATVSRRLWKSSWPSLVWVSPGGSDGKESACNARDLGSIPGLGRPPGDGNGNPLQYSCLKNSMDRGAWRATVHGVAKSQTRLND